MNTAFLIGIIIVAMVMMLVAVFYYMSPARSEQGQIRSLMSFQGSTAADSSHALSDSEADVIENIKKSAGRSEAKSGGDNLNTRLFKAGYFTEADRSRFKALSILSMIIIPLLIVIITWSSGGGIQACIGIGVLGLLVGYSLPQSFLERTIAKRQEEIMYYLPLVIEQVSIGVSSALDIGPCIAMIVVMANERDSHNPVTDMFSHVEKLMRSGLNLEDSLIEVGQASGMNEVKHAFMFLAQCAKHGGEVSKQLQELADAVMVQKQVRVEGRIAQLPVKATGPLAMVFIGFFIFLFAGLFTRIKGTFENLNG